MTVNYPEVVPWGRSFQEYKDMFSLTSECLSRNIIGCGDGPASFNYELTKANGNIVSIDPVYRMSKSEIQTRIDETFETVVEQTSRNKDKFNWDKINNIDELVKIRMDSMNLFLEDYVSGKKEKRYIYGEMPILPFSDYTFDLALSSHFLFLYSENLSYEFHLDSIREMLRVAKEVRIFPIIDFNCGVSIHLEKIINDLSREKHICEIVSVDYEFQKNGNQMLKISKRK